MKRERYPKRPADAVVWREDLSPLLLANGFELGWSGTTAYRKDKQGSLWQCAVIGAKLVNTMWYNYGLTGLADDANPSVSHGWMTRDEFRKRFQEQDVE